MSYIRQKTMQGLKQGDTFSVKRTFAEQDTISFADISKDRNPVHFDDRFTKAKNLRGPICHGLLVASLITEIGGQIGLLASAMNFRFKKPVYFGDTIECLCTITQIDERNHVQVEAIYKNQQNEIVIEAQVRGILPNAEEKKILGIMISEGKP